MGTARKQMTVEEISAYLDRELGLQKKRTASGLKKLRLAIPDNHVPEVLDLLYRYGNELQADDVNTGCTVLISATETDLTAANARTFISGERDF